MKNRDLFRLSDGKYDLTDNIDNYNYELTVGLCNDGVRFYNLIEKGWASRGNIFMFEFFDDYDEYYKYKSLTAISGIGGVRVHSDDTSHILKDLRFTPRGSFKTFIENTKKI